MLAIKLASEMASAQTARSISAQNSGSSETLVRWPARETERLTRGMAGKVAQR